jgi:nicotinic acid phosphoribosyltransferase
MKQRDLADRLFWMANEDEIKNASTTDVYFINTKEVLAKNHIETFHTPESGGS